MGKIVFEVICMPKKRNPSNPAPTPLYSTFPTQFDRFNPETGKTEPDPESVAAVREWGEQSKL